MSSESINSLEICDPSKVEKTLETDVDNKMKLDIINLDGNVEVDPLEKHIPQPHIPIKETYAPALTEAEKAELDKRSIYVGNVDYNSTAKELEEHFKGCGIINKITILTNKHTGHPKGFAYIEFEAEEAVDLATLLDESLFRDRELKVMPKRTNIHGFLNSKSSIILNRGRRGNPTYSAVSMQSRLNHNIPVNVGRNGTLNSPAPRGRGISKRFQGVEGRSMVRGHQDMDRNSNSYNSRVGPTSRGISKIRTKPNHRNAPY